MASFWMKGRIWYYRFIGADGVQYERKGCPDRRETESLAAHEEAESARVRAGLTDPKTEARRRHASAALAQHLADWHVHLMAKGNTVKHGALFLERARRVAALVVGANLGEIDLAQTAKNAERERAIQRVDKILAGARLADLTADAVQRTLAALKTRGRSLGTCITTERQSGDFRSGPGATAAWSKMP